MIVLVELSHANTKTLEHHQSEHWVIAHHSWSGHSLFSGQFCFVTGFGRVLVVPNLSPFNNHEGNRFLLLFFFVIGELIYLPIPEANLKCNFLSVYAGNLWQFRGRPIRDTYS